MLRHGGTFSSNAKPPTGGSRSSAVMVNDVVGERDRVVARDIDAVPLIAIDRVVDQVMRSAVGVDKVQSISPVGINQIIDNQSSGVAAIDCNAAVTRAAAVGENAIELDVDILILIVAAEQRDRLAAGAGNRQAADRDELGLLETNGIIPGACARCTGQYHLARIGCRVGLNDDAVDLGGAGKIVFTGDRKLFGIAARLDLNDVARTGDVDRGLNRRKTRRLATAGGISAIDVQDSLRKCDGGNETKRQEKGEKEKSSPTSVFKHHCLLEKGT